MLLADLGMDVLAVYSPTDPMGVGIPLLGRNERSLTLKLKASKGRAIRPSEIGALEDRNLSGRPGNVAPFYVDRSLLSALSSALLRAVNVGPRPARRQRKEANARPRPVEGQS